MQCEDGVISSRQGLLNLAPQVCKFSEGCARRSLMCQASRDLCRTEHQRGSEIVRVVRNGLMEYAKRKAVGIDVSCQSGRRH